MNKHVSSKYVLKNLKRKRQSDLVSSFLFSIFNQYKICAYLYKKIILLKVWNGPWITMLLIAIMVRFKVIYAAASPNRGVSKVILSMYIL